MKFLFRQDLQDQRDKEERQDEETLERSDSRRSNSSCPSRKSCLKKTSRKRPHLQTLLFTLTVTSVFASAYGSAAAADDLAAEYGKVADRFAQQIERLARWCDSHQLGDEARRTRRWLPKKDPDRLFFGRLTNNPAEPKVPVDASDDQTEWHRRFMQLRDAQAGALFQLALRSADENNVSPGYELLWQTVRQNPNHRAARRALGYDLVDGRWMTPFEHKQHKAGRVWHKKFGWIRGEHLSRYEKGERYESGRWSSTKADARRHASIRRGWKIETDHYLLTTNHSLAEGVRLASELERLQRLWRRAFAGYWLTPAELSLRLKENAPRIRPAPLSKKYRVTYFRDREEYIRTLRPKQPRIEITIGYYLQRSRMAYFFAGDGQDQGTLYHEATHQLFKESRPTIRSPGSLGNFWITEAIACYAESLARDGDFDTLGGTGAVRIQAARERLEDGFYVPLSTLVGLTAEGLQRNRRIASIYSQSAGLATFLMHYQSGRYRPALVKYLRAVYNGKANATTLADLTGVPLEQLDREYRGFFSDNTSTKR